MSSRYPCRPRLAGEGDSSGDTRANRYCAVASKPAPEGVTWRVFAVEPLGFSTAMIVRQSFRHAPCYILVASIDGDLAMKADGPVLRTNPDIDRSTTARSIRR